MMSSSSTSASKSNWRLMTSTSSSSSSSSWAAVASSCTKRKARCTRTGSCMACRQRWHSSVRLTSASSSSQISLGWPAAWRVLPCACQRTGVVGGVSAHSPASRGSSCRGVVPCKVAPASANAVICRRRGSCVCAGAAPAGEDEEGKDFSIVGSVGKNRAQCACVSDKIESGSG